jgi:hypothetical protein
MAASSKQTRTGRGRRIGRVYRKMLVALPADLINKIRAKVGSGNPLRHVAETMEERRRQAALSEFLAHHERKYGPISDEAVQEELDRWDAELRRAEEGTTSRSSWTAKG